MSEPRRRHREDAGESPAPKQSSQDRATQGPPAGYGGVVDRRLGLDRRDLAPADASGLERRRGPGRRLSDFTKAAEEGEMTPEQFLFLVAIDEFKKANDRPYPTWTDVLEVIRLLGYRKTMPSELSLSRAEDWREAANAASGVRPERWHERPTKLGQKGRLRAAEAERAELAAFEDIDLDELGEAA